MARPLFLIVLLFALGATAPRVEAQVTRADSAAVLIEAARDLRDRGEPDAAEALLRLLLDTFGDTPAASQARVDLGMVEQAQSASSGRVELQVWGALYGLWAGLMVPAAASADDSQAYGVGLLLGGPAGFLAASSYSRSHRLSTGQARAITLGGTWGAIQGWGWAQVADVGEEFICTGDVCFGDDSEEDVLWYSLGGSAVGLVAGAMIARNQISPGLATTANFGALWGTWFGIAGGVVADLEDDQLQAAILMAGNAGLASSALLGRGWNLTRSRARLISIAGVLGGLAGGGIDLIGQVDDSKVAMAIPLATSIAGLTIGALATRNGAGAATDVEVPTNAGFGIPSLLSVVDGDVTFGVPLPTPERVLLSTGVRDRFVVTHRLNLFSMRF